MIGAKMIANGAMGPMERSVWYEGSILGTDKMCSNILQNAIRGMMDELVIDLTVEGVGPTRLTFQPGANPIDVQNEFAKHRIRDNVLGLIANAIRSHIISGGNGVLDLNIDL